jgi:hypothetical protein
MCRSDPEGVITVKHVVCVCLSACLLVGIVVVPALGQDKLVAVIDEVEGKEQAPTALTTGGHTFRVPGVLPLESTVLYSARLTEEPNAKLSPGLRLAGVRAGLFASQPEQLPQLLDATRFGLAFRNRLSLATGGLKLTGEWTKVDADFVKGATTDKSIQALVGKMKQAYGVGYEFADGFALFRDFERITTEAPGASNGDVEHHIKTGLSFGPEGGHTSLSFLIDETTKELARSGSDGGRKAITADFGHQFDWGGEGNAALSFHHGQLEKWGTTHGKQESFGTLALEFTRHASAGEQTSDDTKGDDTKGNGKKGDAKAGPPVRTHFSHTVTETTKGSTGLEMLGDVRETVTQLDHNFAWGGKHATLHLLQRQVDKWGPAGKPSEKPVPTLELSFERGNRGKEHDHTWTSISHVVSEKHTGSTGAHNARDVGQTHSALEHGFSFHGRAAKLHFSRTENATWVKQAEASENTVTNAHIDLPITPALSVAADHEATQKGSAPEVTQRTVRLSPTQKSKLHGSWMEFQSLEQGGERPWDQSKLALHSQTVALPFNTTLQGEYTRISRDGTGACDQSVLNLTASTTPVERLQVSANYLSDDHSVSGHKVETNLDASYDINEAMSLQFSRNSSEHDGELQKQQTALTLKCDPGKEGGLGIAASYTAAEHKGKQIDPETALQVSYDLDDGLQTRALYKHRPSGSNEYGAEVAFDMGPMKTTASYIVNGFDGSRKTQDFGNTLDLHCDWEIKKGLQLSTGLRTSSAGRIFAGGVGPRLLLTGKLSKHEELMVGYVPGGSALTDRDHYMPFAPGAHDIKKDINSVSDAACILRYTKIVDQDNLLVAYFRTGSVRLDHGMDKAAGDPFAEKSAWLEFRSTF